MNEAEVFRQVKKKEKDASIRWFPNYQWGDNDNKKSTFERLFGLELNNCGYGWTSFYIEKSGSSLCRIEAFTKGTCQIWIDGELLGETSNISKFNLELNYGKHQLLIKSVCTNEKEWFDEIKLYLEGESVNYICPMNIHGNDQPWVYLGPFSLEEANDFTPEFIQSFYRLFETRSKTTYWRIDKAHVYIRPYLENELFGRWNYPLGVTLYGLLKAGKVLKRKDIIQYVRNHLKECINLYLYSLWDKNQYGYPEINQQISCMDMLDDCGSFGFAMLKALNKNDNDICEDVVYEDNAMSLYIAERIADHMENHQERREDGAFYRICKGHYMENTLWADDLYMSTPFLSSYYEMTGKREYIVDAANQFLLFKKYLYMEDNKIMSHVYDFKYNTPTLMPWGRGNGWVIFSLSELLEVLPEDYEHRDHLLEFFRDLCSGYYKLQGSNGLWHQLLTHPDSYEETSCTAMFIYAFARGIRFGWFDKENDKYLEAVLKGWKGLTQKSIDYRGNVYGVCGGSAYSFTPEYYKEELLWRTNDTHGIGIVMLAGIEVVLLQEMG
jgi:unsaturated rhamnogalacturonyl hydrolase